MAQTTVIQGTTISDIYTRLIPGLLFVLPLAGTTGFFSNNGIFWSDTTASLLLIAVAALVVGELTNHFRTSADGGVPPEFRRLFYDGSRVGVLSLGDRIRTEEGRKAQHPVLSPVGKLTERIWGRPEPARAIVFDQNGKDFKSTVESHFSVDLESTTPRHVYNMCKTHLFSNLPAETRRSYYIYNMRANILMLLTATFPLSLLFVLFTILGAYLPFYQFPLQLVVFGVSLLSMSIFYFVLHLYFWDPDRHFVQQTLDEYYYDRFESQ